LAWSLALAALGGLDAREAAAEEAVKPAPRVATLYHKDRSFRIPFNISEQGRNQLKEVQLWVSEDSGFSWKPASKTTPDLGKFTFRARRDGEYWFAVRTVTIDDRYAPPLDQTVEPSMKVIIDSVPPSLILEADGRRGSTAQVRWEAKDENLDLKTFILEYQVDGIREWKRVPLRKAAVVGVQKWDAGTADALRVKASVSDRAGNVAESVIALPEGAATSSDLTLDAEASSAPPIDQISQRTDSLIDAGPGFPPVEEAPVPAPRQAPRNARGVSARKPRAEANDGFGPAADPFPPPADWERPPSRVARNRSPEPSVAPASGFPDPFPNPNGEPPAPAPSAPQASSATGDNGTILVGSPQFKLQYEVNDAGPGGPDKVELWQTHDGGRTWNRRGVDEDRTSPFDVNLGGEGTFGLTLVALSASGLGDRPPAPGDVPQTWVEVDSTPPTVQLFPVRVGTGVYAGKVAVSWRATDPHLPPRSVTLFWRPDNSDGAWTPIDGAQTLENSGQFVWAVPPTVPPRFHVRVEAVDTLGNRGGAESTNTAPIIVDRSRPRGRIIGLDPNARSGDGPSARPLR